MDDIPVTIARWNGPRGEVVLRRRGSGDGAIEELIVNGAFAMDSAETTSERALADLVPPGARVLVGGLGLGFTTAALLDAGVGAIDVVEIEEALVAWAHEGATAQLGRAGRDPRVRLWVADVRAVLTGDEPEPTGPWDAILLDVDNGPDFLIHAENAALYELEALSVVYAKLAPRGLLAIWCQGRAPELWSRLRTLTATAREEVHQVQRGRHLISYVIYTARAPG